MTSDTLEAFMKEIGILDRPPARKEHVKRPKVDYTAWKPSYIGDEPPF